MSIIRTTLSTISTVPIIEVTGEPAKARGVSGRGNRQESVAEIDDPLLTSRNIIVETKAFGDADHKLVLYHGSKKGITGDIAPISRGECDFGSVFYMGTSPLQPLTFVCNEDKPKFCAVEMDMTRLKALTVEIGIDWAMLIAYYRKESNKKL